MPLSPELVPVAVLMTTTVVYVAHFYLGTVKTGAPAEVFRRRLLGVLFLGLIPLAVDGLWLPGSPTTHGLAFGDPTRGAPAVALLAVILAPILLTAGGKPSQLATYPQIRLPVARWDRALVVKNAASWAIFLLAYEWLFRGFLLSAVVAAWGVWPGMAVMIALYVLVHLDKSPAEAFSCFPMGLVFGLLALETGGIFWPWILHMGIAVGTEMSSLRAMRAAGP